MNDQPLTFEQLQKTIEALTPVLYYGLSEIAERGQVYICKETEWYPRFAVLHPDDFEQFKREISPVRLVKIGLEPTQDRMERFLKRMEHHAVDAPVEA